MITNTRAYVQFKLGKKRLIWVDPRKINFHVGTNEPTSEAVKQRIDFLGRRIPILRGSARALVTILGQSDPWVIAARHYRRPELIENETRHILIADFLACRDRPKDSLWHDLLLQQLAKTGEAKHKEIRMRSEAEIDDFLRDYVLGLIQSLETSGYDENCAPDTGTALIGADGTIHKAHNGNHRFCAARLVGVKSLPLKILGAHEDWIARVVGPRLDIGKLRLALENVAERFA